MLKKIAIVLGVLVLGFLGVVMAQPADFHVERSTSIQAPPEVVFGYLNDFHHWSTWSPWERLDPNMQREHSGVAAGVGAKYAWSGNDQVGRGSMTITVSNSPERLVLDLQFLAPWEAQNVTTFTLAPEAQGTKLTWAMDGKQNFMAKAASLFLDMDQLVGSDFDKGLANLKALAETQAQRLATETKARSLADAEATAQAELEAVVEDEARAAQESEAE